MALLPAIGLMLVLAAFPFFLPQFRVIFFPTSKKHLTYLKDYLKPADSDIVYDIGCGNGRVLKSIVAGTQARGVGIELSPLVYLAAKLNLLRVKNIRVVWGDIFKKDLSESTIIYCFLNKEVLEKLVPKFKRELNPQTKIVSYIFKIPGLKGEDVVKDSLGQELFHVYKTFPEAL